VVTRTLAQIEAVLSPSRSGGRFATRVEDAELKARRAEQAAGGGPTAARLASIRLERRGSQPSR
jgi:hypothetical protein